MAAALHNRICERRLAAIRTTDWFAEDVSLLSVQVGKLPEADLSAGDIPEGWKIVIAHRAKKAADDTKGMGPTSCGPKTMDANPGPSCREHFICQENRLT
jgi:hypothetical protein